MQPVVEESGVVAALNHDGYGVVRAGKAAFVPGVLPGEEIRFLRSKRHRQYDEARLLEILRPAVDRVEPRCRFFGVCGGCALQHLAPAAQLAAKQLELQEALRRIGQVEPEHWLPPLQGPSWHYRRRARLGAKYVKARQRVLVGFRERLSGLIAALDSCQVLAQPVGDLLLPLGEMLSNLSIRDRVPQVEVAVGDNQTGLVLRVLAEPTERDRTVLAAFEQQHSLRLFLQPGNASTIAPLSAGDATLSYALPEWNLSLQFLPADFIQINGAVNRALLAKVIDLLQIDADATVLDLFCGLGNFTLPLARRALQVTGVEGEAGLVQRARDNARNNGIANADFHVADLARPAEAAWWKSRYSHVLLDPPRTGAREVLALVAELQPRRVVYVSCHPGSLARDVGILVNEFGFVFETAGAVDMFPHTTHVESVAVLRAGKGRHS
jgi:23S rRNA (uracil1939-C5)-methyltransferase